MKKILAIILCLVMLLSLAACSNTATDTAEEDTTAAPETESQSASETNAPETDASESESAEEADGEEHDHVHINYRGRTEYFDADDLAEIEGRERDFVYEQGEYNLYVYNNVTIDGMDFTQVQFTFNGTTARVSATYSTNMLLTEQAPTAEEIEKDTEEKLAFFNETLSAMYGEGTVGEQHGSNYTSWSDHTGNYIILTRINESTIQVAYYIGA